MVAAAGISASLESAQKKLRYEDPTGRKKLEQDLFALKVEDLKTPCKELHVKFGSARKAELVGRLLSW